MMSTDGTASAVHRRRHRLTQLGVVSVGLLSILSFGWNLSAEPSFADEWAYISQTYFGPLWWEGHWNDAAWLTYPAVDLPPLPKYLIAVMIRLGDQPMPGPGDAMDWYRDTGSTFGGQELLIWARWPMVVLGGIGCAAAVAVGAIVFGPRAGLLAGLLLAINPLYRMHARRAMSDVPTEAFTLLALALGLWAWRELLRGRRTGLAVSVMILGTGILSGLAALSKLSGGLATMSLLAWCGLTVALPGVPTRRKGWVVGSILLAALVAYGTFILGNPVLSASPSLAVDAWEGTDSLADRGLIGRTLAVMEHRAGVSQAAQEHPIFKKQGYPLTDIGSKLGVVVVQGFGRFGPFGPRSTDSLIRYDWRQDQGALVWGPLVLAGLVWTFRLGRKQFQAGEPPTGWAVLLQFMVVFLTVTLFIPMAWDRYLLPIQSGASILAGGFIAGVIGEGLRAIRREEAPGA